jgi:hypothetical protein
MLLHKIHNETDKPKSGGGLKIAFYLLLLVVAYFAGYYERPKTHAPADESVPQATLSAVPSSQAPTDDAAAAVPLSSPAAALSTPAAVPSATPGIIGDISTATPPQVEKAVVVAPSAAPSSAPAPAAAPAKQANQVTITEPVEIPVKEGGKITGYINLQRGQVITPIAVEQDQIKIQSGTSFVMVPVKSTDMAH